MSRQQKPADSIRYGNLEATIWKNEGENKDFLNTTFTRNYHQDDTWHQTSSFQEADLPTLSKLADDAHTRIQEIKKEAEESSE